MAPKSGARQPLNRSRFGHGEFQCNSVCGQDSGSGLACSTCLRRSSGRYIGRYCWFD
jgi:hypothetical protein